MHSFRGHVTGGQKGGVGLELARPRQTPTTTPDGIRWHRLLLSWNRRRHTPAAIVTLLFFLLLQMVAGSKGMIEVQLRKLQNRLRALVNARGKNASSIEFSGIISLAAATITIERGSSSGHNFQPAAKTDNRQK